jgi:teichuronic acid biosynthesis glycosyltransferase TuaC
MEPYSAAMLRVLVVSNLYPSPRHPGWGTFIRDQVRSLEEHVSIQLVAKYSPSAAAYPAFFARTAAALLGGGHDLVHAHYGFHSALLPALLGRKPLIATFHGSDALIEARRCALYGNLQRLVVRRAACLIAVSPGVRAALIESLGAPPERVRLLSCGVDAERFRPGDRAEARSRLGLPREGQRVLFIGRMTAAKGIDVLGACIERLTGVEFDLLGPGASPCEAPHCHLHGVRPHEEIPLWIQAADILVLPSRTEGTPVTVLEALASERPVVCTDVGSCADLVAPAVTGEIVPPGDAEAFTSAVRRALVARDYRPAEGRAKILGEYEMRLRARQLLALYEEVRAATGPRSVRGVDAD